MAGTKGSKSSPDAALPNPMQSSGSSSGMLIDPSACGSTRPIHTRMVAPSMQSLLARLAQAATSAPPTQDMNPLGKVRFCTLRCQAEEGTANTSFPSSSRTSKAVTSTSAPSAAVPH